MQGGADQETRIAADIRKQSRTAQVGRAGGGRLLEGRSTDPRDLVSLHMELAVPGSLEFYRAAVSQEIYSHPDITALHEMAPASEP